METIEYPHKLVGQVKYIAMGLGQGIMPLISYNYASGNTDRMKKVLVFTMKTALISMTAVSIGYYLGAGALTAAFMKNPVIVQHGTKLLRGLCLSIPFLCVDFLASAQACGDTMAKTDTGGPKPVGKRI